MQHCAEHYASQGVRLLTEKEYHTTCIQGLPEWGSGSVPTSSAPPCAPRQSLVSPYQPLSLSDVRGLSVLSCLQAPGEHSLGLKPLFMQQGPSLGLRMDTGPSRCFDWKDGVQPSAPMGNCSCSSKSLRPLGPQNEVQILLPGHLALITYSPFLLFSKARSPPLVKITVLYL